MKRIALFLIIGLSLFVAANSQTKPSLKQADTKIDNTVPCTLYFTFDDGPLNGSEHIDSVILAEKLKISVFLVGEHVEKNKQMSEYFKYYEENPYIDEYNHSYSHANNHYKEFYSNPAKAMADIQKNQTLLKLPYKIVRLPGRNMWRIAGRKRDDGVSGASTADGLATQGYKVIGWDLEWQHKPDGTPVQSVDQIQAEINNLRKNGNSFTKNNIVVLLHDEMFQKPWEESELKQLLENLKKENKYIFEQIRFYPQ